MRMYCLVPGCTPFCNRYIPGMFRLRLCTVVKYTIVIAILLFVAVLLLGVVDNAVVSPDLLNSSDRYIKSNRNLLEETNQHDEDSVVNPHPFRYLLNPEAFCLGREVFVIAYIHSAPAHTNNRLMIRSTWASRQMFLNKTTLVVFIMGKVNDSKIMEAVKKESDHYGDIVQEDFVDSYRNLTYKAIAGLKWVSTFCSHAVYVLKTDDDIFVNMTFLLNYIQSSLETSHGRTDTIMCLIMHNSTVIRSKKSKWYVSEKEFPSTYYEDYCMGVAYLMSADLAGKLYNISFFTPFYWIDDYYITGLLIHKLHIKHRYFNDAYHFNKLGQPKKPYAFYNVPAVWKLLFYWNQMMADENNNRKHVHERKHTT